MEDYRFQKQNLRFRSPGLRPLAGRRTRLLELEIEANTSQQTNKRKRPEFVKVYENEFMGK